MPDVRALSDIFSLKSRGSYLQIFSVNHGNLKGGDNYRTHVEGSLRPANLLQQLGPFWLRAMVQQYRHLEQTCDPVQSAEEQPTPPEFSVGSENSSRYLWCKTLEFTDPVGQSGEGGHHQERTQHFLFYHHGDVSDALNGLAQSHLISQDPVDAILPQHLLPQETTG